jgi:hypothetical protein
LARKERPVADEGFEGEIVLEAPVNIGAPEGLAGLSTKFVRYPGCQQLVLWLPQPGRQGYGQFRIFGPDDAVVEDAPVSSRLNGSIQILTDTFAWPPGAYRVEIDHADGWRHELHMRKLEEGVAAPQPPPPVAEEKPSDAPRIYRDGLGNVLPNLDLEMRAQVLENIVAKFSRRLEFEGNARAGIIIYIEGERRIRFSHEMCIGRVKFSIDLPRPQHWEAQTNTPLSERDDIVDFVAREARRTQASSWSYEIHEDRIDFVD